MSANGPVIEEIRDEWLPGLLAVRLSNPGRLAVVEGSRGEAGCYDLAMLERDVWMVSLDEARHLLVAVDAGSGAVVGYADYLDAHPRDGLPVLGAVEVAADRHRRGIGRALVEAVVARIPAEATALRVRVVPGRDPAGFLVAVGFRPVPGDGGGLLERAAAR
ncbi:GNAT family N-acetyltransferase [Kitasatospora sp. GP82]|uniref:GNAT family N-acetyltransferase n=1 Tax=Kitasatospora sp. GP82 TaxID=3035089 RepID=UPI002473296A|nr:GNAT family N-acetyltransferase [Kitasatospora sp. GP82]MDH6126866.1 GNAT superfamily N-acetyltransferase [Kitasatospora sp. GP82]